MNRNSFKVIFFILAFSMPGFLLSQRFLSLENSGKFKRIRIEDGIRIAIKERHSEYPLRGVVSRITQDSIYLGTTGIAVDSIYLIALPPGKGAQYAIGLLAAGVPGSFVVAIITLVNNLALYPHDKNKLVIPAAFTGLGLGLLFVVVKLSKRKFKIGPHWELKVMEIPLFD